jgi:pyrroline-5-carboxylate reductase
VNGSSRILLVGFGNMGRALAEGWLQRGHSGAAIDVVDAVPAARAAAAELGLAAHEPGVFPGRGHDVVLLAVKPQHIDEAARAFVSLARAGVPFLSIAAGRTIESLRGILGPAAAIVRAMPNTPAAIGQGMTVLCASAQVDGTQRALCEALLAAVGEVAWVEDETLMDAVTAVSGSGPAYVFLLIECLIEAGVEAGLDRPFAAKLATQTVAGAGAYAARADAAPAELRRRVTSPNGTTEAALDVLMADDALAGLVRRAVAAAARRSRELSGG